MLTLMLKMSDIARFIRSSAALVAGRWQIPLAMVALLACALAVYRLVPKRETVPFDTLLAQVYELAEAGRFHDATDALANLLQMDPPLPREERAHLHDTLASMIYRQEAARTRPIRENVELLLEHHQAADRLGRKPDAFAALRAGCAYEWQANLKAALNNFRSALERNPDVDTRRTALQALVRLLMANPEADAERRGYIEALLAEQGVSTHYLWWALQYAVQEALDQADLDRAQSLVEKYGDRFKRSDLRGYYDYLWAWVYVAQQNHAQAEPYLDLARAWLNDHPESDPEMDRAGFLPSMVEWLRGRIHLDEDRPQVALAQFEKALALQSYGDLAINATMGQMQALAMLERHQAAREAARVTAGRMALDPGTLARAQPRFRSEALTLCDERHAVGDYGNAIDYLDLALDLTPSDQEALRLDLHERLGREHEDAAAIAATPEKRREELASAARNYQAAAELAVLEEPRYATLLWSAAQQYDAAGRTLDARRMLTKFVDGRDLDPRRPQALLELGQGYAAEGRFEDALKWYARIISQYPKLEEAAQARLLTADTLIALGEEHHPQAQQILIDLLDGSDVAPEARVYRDALFALCDLHYQSGRYAEAIGRIETFLGFYPNDEEAYRLRFMLADSFRRSAYTLRDNPPKDVPAEAAQLESRRRFQHAAGLFETYVREVGEHDGSSDSARLYERLALFYRGDCLYELNDPETLAEALATYRQAAARYQNEPATLTAQVQIANIYIRQGKFKDAAAAVERARWLLRNIPDRAFEDYDDGMDRNHWDRLLATVASSHLFADL